MVFRKKIENEKLAVKEYVKWSKKVLKAKVCMDEIYFLRLRVL